MVRHPGTRRNLARAAPSAEVRAMTRVVPAMDPALADDVGPFHARYRAEGHWDDMRLGTRVTQYAHRTPKAEAVVDLLGARRINFGDFDRLTNRFAHFLARSGIEEGDVISMQLPNWMEAAVISVGANKAGVVVNPMLPIYRAKEIRYILEMTRARAIFTPDEYRGFSHKTLAAEIARDIGHDLMPVTIATPAPGAGGSAWLDTLSRY
ncbi:MAG: AMP-binding protein, partial [Alphaproteobacteria bacterium]|nr:AMP-binding protein [Alphaproteobacteria bacterium]